MYGRDDYKLLLSYPLQQWYSPVARSDIQTTYAHINSYQVPGTIFVYPIYHDICPLDLCLLLPGGVVTQIPGDVRFSCLGPLLLSAPSIFMAITPFCARRRESKSDTYAARRSQQWSKYSKKKYPRFHRLSAMEYVLQDFIPTMPRGAFSCEVRTSKYFRNYFRNLSTVRFEVQDQVHNGTVQR